LLISPQVILFASKPLDNTTHSIVIQNLRNPIVGVVGVVSLDSFSFTTDVEGTLATTRKLGRQPHPPIVSYILIIAPTTVDPVTAPAARSPNLSTGGIVGIVIGSVVVAVLFLALARFCTGRRRRRRQGASNHSTKSTKNLRTLFLSPGIPWKRHKHTASSESSPIIDAVWNSKPVVVVAAGT
jgi:hypothetical protein